MAVSDAAWTCLIKGFSLGPKTKHFLPVNFPIFCTAFFSFHSPIFKQGTKLVTRIVTQILLVGGGRSANAQSLGVSFYLYEQYG